MSAPDLNRTEAFLKGKTAEDFSITADPLAKAQPVDVNATGQYPLPSAGSRGSASELEFGSILPSIPGFVIEGELGRGGMGVVYRARQSDLKRPVAIKMLLGGKYTDALAQARFFIEAEVIAAIQHPNVVQVYDFGRHDDQPFFVMELVVGGSLAGKRESGDRFTPQRAAALVAKLADGIAAAHQLGVVHRDLKPANVLLTHAGEPKITDFGLAKMGQSDMTASGAIMGTPSYMSPEQAAGKTREVGTSTDVYALGAILYELITCQPPFLGQSVMETIQQVLTSEPRRPLTLNLRVPHDLETICLKCLNKDVHKRYATASELSADLHRFLEGRPIDARPVGLTERAWKWARRNPAWSVGIAAACLLLLGAGVALPMIRAHVVAQQKEIQASGLVQRLLIANTADVPAIVKEMDSYRPGINPQLRDAANEAELSQDSRKQLHASLALLPVDGAQIDYLTTRLLNALPQEVPILRDALTPHQDALRGKLWEAATRPDQVKGPQRLPAAAALAKFDPDSSNWSRAAPLVIDDLVRENPIYLGQWSESFRPVRSWLLAPLIKIFAERDPDRATERTLATNLLVDYAADNLQVSTELLLNADEKQFAVIYPRFKEIGAAGIPRLTAEIDVQLPKDLAASDPKREVLAKRQANAAVALLRLEQPEKVWPLFRHSPDPRLRTYLIHRLAPLDVDDSTLIKRLQHEPDLTARRALLLSLGEFSERQLPPAERSALLPELQKIYRTEPDPGLHAGAEWLLRQWQQAPWLGQINDDWVKGRGRREGWWSASADKQTPAAGPRWYVNPQGQTMVVLPGPTEFLRGSPALEVGRDIDREQQYRQRVGRTFAISSKLVTVEQFQRFHRARFGTDHSYPTRLVPSTDCPVIKVDWFMAAEYCNWLSHQEGLTPCYEPNPAGKFEKGLKMAPDYLRRTGYRLPTEAEWELACRAGTVTSWFFGEAEDLLRRYVWYVVNADNHLWPVARLKPNDFGLFDMNGNVWTMCHDKWEPIPAHGKPGELVEDIPAGGPISGDESRTWRGGSYINQTRFVRSANRRGDLPTDRSDNIGFRVVRTVVP